MIGSTKRFLLSLGLVALVGSLLVAVAVAQEEAAEPAGSDATARLDRASRRCQTSPGLAAGVQTANRSILPRSAHG